MDLLQFIRYRLAAIILLLVLLGEDVRDVRADIVSLYSIGDTLGSIRGYHGSLVLGREGV